MQYTNGRDFEGMALGECLTLIYFLSFIVCFLKTFNVFQHSMLASLPGEELP